MYMYRLPSQTTCTCLRAFVLSSIWTGVKAYFPINMTRTVTNKDSVDFLLFCSNITCCLCSCHKGEGFKCKMGKTGSPGTEILSGNQGRTRQGQAMAG